MFQKSHAHGAHARRSIRETRETGETRETPTASHTQQRQRRKAAKQPLREQARTRRADRWEAFKLLVVLPLVSVSFTAIGLLMVAGAIFTRDGGAFGFALMVLGLGVGTLSPTIAHYLEYFEGRAARRSAPSAVRESGQKIVNRAQQALSQEGSTAGERRRSTTTRSSGTSPGYAALLIIPTLFAAACWATGVGFMLVSYGPGQLVGGASKAVPVWVLAVLVWGGLAALGITVLVRYITDRRER